MADTEDSRSVELETLVAIFPEIQVNETDTYTFSLDLPVNPQCEVIVVFPATNEAPLVESQQNSQATLEPRIESHAVSYLPSLQVRLSLPAGYPADQPPAINLSTTPPWIPSDVIRRLEQDVPRLWEELGRDSVAYTYIDHLQQATDDVFGMLDTTGKLELSSEHKIALLDYDVQEKRAAFERGTYDCGVCLEPKKGSACHRMADCGHVFCKQCLQDFYNNAIKQGDLATVRCLEPSCAKEREKAALASGTRRKFKAFISPGELLQIPLEHEVVQRYVNLKYKTELESDKDTVYCPRSWCQGAARSTKHKKPAGLLLQDGDDDDSGVENEPDSPAADGREGSAKAKVLPRAELMAQQLAICEDCGFAFCSRCNQSWHGEFYYCSPARDKDELTAEEKATLEYMKLHSTKCPTCGAPAQKSMGCNHMTCFRCQSHFCYLCSAWLDPNNPYKHFNELDGGRRTGCYNRLWELEGGDGNAADEGYNMPQVWEFESDDDSDLDEEEDDDEEIVIEQVRGVRPGPAPPGARPNGRGGRGRVNFPRGQRQQNEEARAAAPAQNVLVQVERQGPLVLRIEANVVPPEPPQVNDAAVGQRDGPAAAAAAAAAHRQGQNRGGHRGEARAGRGDHYDRGRGGRRARVLPGAGLARHANLNGRGAGARAVAHEAAEPGAWEPDEAEQAWIRQFVQLALEDAEHLID
jgi:E3 ubiquitin-protein ligase RNF14